MPRKTNVQEDPTWGGAAITFPSIQGTDTVGIVVPAGRMLIPA